MITVTESKYLDGTGDILKNIEYPKFDGYRLQLDGSLVIWRSNRPKPQDLIPGSVNYLPQDDPLEEIVYVKGSFTRVHRS